ncbi:hypothetical protein QAD02_012907 [Eretmocerus hayati]|uniref:Uncharacterized protein n=1 Tax=Eretmocerus hayati TaxID=131215 RepID=A0ACC2P115_9HYME|nr:hypothetical protein QAD02_012907 [Eretmocerus hayati]
MGTSITRSSDDRLIEIPQIDVESVPCQVDVSIAGESVKNEHIEQDGIHFLLDCTGEEECASQMLTIFQPHCSDNPSHALIQVTTNSSSDVDTESCDKSKGMKFIESGGPGDSQSDQRRSELIQHVRVAEGIEMVVLDSISASESDASNHISSALGFRHTSTSLSGPSSAKEMITIQSTQKDPSALCSNPGFAVVDDTICPLYIPGTPEAQERDQDQESAISTSSYEIPPCEDLNIESSAIVPHELVIPNDGKEDRTGTEISSHASSSLFASLEGKTRSPLIPMDHDDTDADGSGMFTRDHLRTDDDSQS